MNEKQRAEDNLAVIRSMMERATVYRMISGPTAIFAGVLTIICSFMSFTEKVNQETWTLSWLGVAMLVMIFNTALVLKKARGEKMPVFSPGLKMGLKSLVPVFGVGLIVTVFSQSTLDAHNLVHLWMVCYGLGLMATGQMAPRSLWFFGLIFVGSGLLFYLSNVGECSGANNIMRFTFGGYHMAYGLYVMFIENKRS